MRREGRKCKEMKQVGRRNEAVANTCDKAGYTTSLESCAVSFV